MAEEVTAVSSFWSLEVAERREIGPETLLPALAPQGEEPGLEMVTCNHPQNALVESLSRPQDNGSRTLFFLAEEDNYGAGRTPAITLPEPRETSACLSPLPTWRQVSAARGRGGCSDGVAKAGQGSRAADRRGLLGARGASCPCGGCQQGTSTVLRAPGLGRGCLGCARHPT